jgi:hypothetical protein
MAELVHRSEPWMRYAACMAKNKQRPQEAGSHTRALLVLMLYGFLAGAVVCAGAYFGAYQMHRTDLH